LKKVARKCFQRRLKAGSISEPGDGETPFGWKTDDGKKDKAGRGKNGWPNTKWKKKVAEKSS